jgi:hypothetical protein
MARYVNSDVMLTRPAGEAVHLDRLRAYFKLIIDLAADDIFPGEEIRIRWRFNLGPSIGVTSVNARFRIDGHLVLETNGIPITAALEGTGSQTTAIKPTDPALAQQLYKIGSRIVELQVSAGEANVYRARGAFRVRREPIDATWWTWREPGTKTIEWKKDYVVSGTFDNKAHAKLATLKVELPELENLRFSQDVNPCDYGPVKEQTLTNLAAGSRTPVSFTLKHDWRWLMASTYLVDGPLSKDFVYAVALHATDEFGNAYPYVCSERLYRVVSVSQLKRDAGSAAAASAVTALGFAIAAGVALASVFGAPAAPALAAAAAGAYAVAAASGAIAKDPPVADPNYREPVVVASSSLPAWTTGGDGPRLEALRRLLEIAERIFASEAARTLTRSRMIGARVFGDAEALERQQAGYERITREMGEAAAQLDQLLSEVQAEIEAIEHLNPSRLASELDRLARSGFSRELYELISRTGIAPELMRDLAALPTIAVLSDVVRANGVFLIPLVGSLKRFVKDVDSERDVILAGEDFCAPPPGAGEEPSEDEEGLVPVPPRTPARRRCCCG